MRSQGSSYRESCFDVFPEKFINHLHAAVESDLDDRVVLMVVRLLPLLRSQKQADVVKSLVSDGYDMHFLLDGESLLDRTHGILEVLRGVEKLRRFE